MHCERAQEFFSDYLEQSLDRPMLVALEAHLGGCLPCREEVETLQTTFAVLDAVPEVEPRWDGVNDVMLRIRAARAEQVLEERRAAPTFLGWLRSLSPVRVATGAGLATIVIAGTLLLPGVSEHIQSTFWPVRSGEGATQVTPAGAPTVHVSYGPIAGQMQPLTLQVVPAGEVPDAQIRVFGSSRNLDLPGAGAMSPARPASLTVQLPAEGGVETLGVSVKSATLGTEHRYLVVAPVGDRSAAPVDLVVSGQTMEETLRRLGPWLDRPVVADSAVEGTIDLGVEGGSVRQCLQELAAQARARLIVEADAYRLIPLR